MQRDDGAGAAQGKAALLRLQRPRAMAEELLEQNQRELVRLEVLEDELRRTSVVARQLEAGEPIGSAGRPRPAPQIGVVERGVPRKVLGPVVRRLAFGRAGVEHGHVEAGTAERHRLPIAGSADAAVLEWPEKLGSNDADARAGHRGAVGSHAVAGAPSADRRSGVRMTAMPHSKATPIPEQPLQHWCE